MNILITNDDSIGAEQLLPLILWCKQLGNVTVVVPKFEQSGKSHGIEIHKAFEAKPVSLLPDVPVWVVDSTPADCVRFAILGLQQQFDLVISGINKGLNIGADMMYSGTVAAACEAVNLGVQAISLSTSPKYYDRVISQLDRVFAFVQEHKLLEKHDLYNINIPGDCKQIRITRQGGPYYSDDFPAIGDHMYRPTGKPIWEDRGDDTLDTDATLHGYTTITPLTVNKTDLSVYQTLTALNP